MGIDFIERPVLRAWRQPWDFFVGFGLAGMNQSGKIEVAATGVNLEQYVPGRELPPTFMLEDGAIQQLMNDLWNMGFRPSEDATPSKKSLEAVNYHLEDMRRLAFGALGVDAK